VAFVALALLGLLWSVVSRFWFNVGLIRGAWLGALRPSPPPGDLVRVDGAAMRRLVGGLAAVVAGLCPDLSSTALIAGLVSLVSARLALLPLIAGAAIFVAVWERPADSAADHGSSVSKVRWPLSAAGKGCWRPRGGGFSCWLGHGRDPGPGAAWRWEVGCWWRCPWWAVCQAVAYRHCVIWSPLWRRALSAETYWRT